LLAVPILLVVETVRDEFSAQEPILPS
jgi:hypothetical protein